MRRVGRLVLDRRVDNFFAETEQVAFCTQNIVPGIDFTQRSAAAGPQLLVPRHADQAARRPELHAHPGQRAEVPDRPLPAGRPHGDEQPGRPRQLRAELVARRRAGPREDPEGGFTSFAAERGGRQAAAAPGELRRPLQPGRQFFRSQTPIEQQHIADAFTFELSKVETAGDPRADGGQSPQRRRGPCRHDRRPARPRTIAGRRRPQPRAPDQISRRRRR